MDWYLSSRADRRALPLADRHYNRQKPGSPQFVPPGRCLVLLTGDRRALWTTSWPFAQFVKHEWAGAWMCSMFRNEGSALGSELIVQAVAATRWRYGEPPPLGMVTFIDPRKVPGYFRRTRTGQVLEWGYSFYKAGFRYVGWTKGGLFAMRLDPADMPEPDPPFGVQLSLVG